MIASGAGDFPLNNLPFGVYRQGGGPPTIGVAICHSILDLRACAGNGLLDGLSPALLEACRAAALNSLMQLGQEARRCLRQRLMELLGERTHSARVQPWLVAQDAVTMLLPAHIGGYTDFYASVHHATNVGRLFRPDQPLLPNYKYVPIGYHGRPSSIVPSGVDVCRPWGQLRRAPDASPVFAPTQMLDYELEVGMFVGQGNALGEPVPIDDAQGRFFGMCLVNDWSARDVQAWEYQPLGPFLAKNFATTISPWVVTMEALEPFRVPAPQRPAGDPPLLAYLDSSTDRANGSLNITVEAWLETAEMRRQNLPAICLSAGNLRDLYWTPAQMLTHHTSNGCNLLPGDLLATGTISGATPDSLGCLLEITKRGAHPLTLPNGETRTFLEDGDEVILRAFCERPGAGRLGFGECRGRVLPAHPRSTGSPAGV